MIITILLAIITVDRISCEEQDYTFLFCCWRLYFPAPCVPLLVLRYDNVSVYDVQANR